MRRLTCLTLTLCGLVVGCASKDETSPPPPRVDPVDSPTADEQVTFTGSAEFGATIEITGAKAVEPAEVKVDRYDASFRAVVTLKKNAKNELSFAARDRAGNLSDPTVVNIEQEDGHNIPAALTLELYVNDAKEPVDDPITIAAGDTLHAKTQVADVAGHVLDLPIGLSTSIPQAFVAGRDISNITVAGKFAVAATAAAGSLALSRNVTVTAGPATQIALDVSPASVMAGTTVYVHAVALDAFGNELPDAGIVLSSEPALDASYTPACTDKAIEQGFLDEKRFVAYDLSGVANTGYVFTLTATSGEVSATAPVSVRPGPASRFAPLDPSDCKAGDFFAFTDATWQNDVAEPVSVAAGDTVYYRYGVVDAFGNATDGPVSVVTSAPGANVIDDGVSGRGQVAHLTTAGTFDLTAYVAGVSAPAVKSFSVDVGNANSASIFLTSSLVSPGDEVIAFATVRDAYGNVVACPAGTVASGTLEILAEPAATATGGTTTCADGLFQRTFTFSENATYSVTVTYKKGGSVSASAYVTVLGIDATPPTVAIANLVVNGTPCTPSGTPPTCNVARGDTVEFDLVANDNIALSELQYSAFFETINRLQTRNLLLAANTALPATVHFSFTIQNGALAEDVPLVGLAIDGAGNRATSAELILRVGVYGTFGRSVAVIASGGSVIAPMDVALNAAGDLFIANDGGNNLLRVASATNTPFVFSNFNRASNYLVVDGSGRLFVTDGTRVSRISADGNTVDNYLTVPGGAEGLDIVGATVAKGTVDANAAVDAAIVTIGGQIFELDVTPNGCGAGRVCVVAGGNKNMALATAVQANSTMVNATYDASNKVVLSAKIAGEAGDTITLTTTGMTVSGATLTQGHGEEFMLGQTNDNNLYRMPETLTPTAVLASNHGAFNVGGLQRGVAATDMTTATSVAARDLYFYFVDDGNTNRLRGYHAVDNGAPTSVFSLMNGPTQGFQSLYDVALEPTAPVPANNPVNGCLLVSDSQRGEIYAVDTRDPTDTTPTVTLIATGFNDPRGLAFFAGNLYVADRGDDAIIRLSPSASSSDCF